MANNQRSDQERVGLTCREKKLSRFFDFPSLLIFLYISISSSLFLISDFVSLSSAILPTQLHWVRVLPYFLPTQLHWVIESKRRPQWWQRYVCWTSLSGEKLWNKCFYLPSLVQHFCSLLAFWLLAIIEGGVFAKLLSVRLLVLFTWAYREAGHGLKFHPNFLQSKRGTR